MSHSLPLENSGQPIAADDYIPKPAETAQNDSEAFRSVPQASESIPQPSETAEKFTLTVREVARMLENAGVARTERSVVNWCQTDANGLSRLGARKDRNDGRYYITKESVHRVIEEEHAKSKQAGFDPSQTSSETQKTSEGTTEQSETNALAKTRRRLKELEHELRDKEIATRVKDSFIETLQKERETFGEERQKYVEALSETNRQLGRLEGQLKQLESGEEKQHEWSTNPSPDQMEGEADQSLNVIASE